MAQTIYKVSQVNAYIKNLFDNDYALRQISVRGEVSNCSYNGSGHIYFTIKDETGALSCVMFAGKRAKGLSFELKDGQKIIVSGNVSIYEITGRYQLYASNIVLDGIGDLFKKFEETKKRLEEMGMFSEEYKKPIPRYASKIGIVTASTGAAIQDIINISTRRNPYIQLYLYPAIVQGEYSAPSIVKGIEKLDEMNLDVIIVGRGGGSFEDLWSFNEEIVAKAIFDANTPIISAVGHEVDFTIADYVSDLRAPTPSAAAELAVFDVHAFEEELEDAAQHMSMSMHRCYDMKKLLAMQYKAKLEKLSPSSMLELKRQGLMMDREQLRIIFGKKLEEVKTMLMVMAERLSAKNPLQKLSDGFGYVSNGTGKTVKSINDADIDEEINIHVTDGKIKAIVREKIKA